MRSQEVAVFRRQIFQDVVAQRSQAGSRLDKSASAPGEPCSIRAVISCNRPIGTSPKPVVLSASVRSPFNRVPFRSKG
jgi:hypothetical protein